MESARELLLAEQARARHRATARAVRAANRAGRLTARPAALTCIRCAASGSN